ncbi:MAG: PEP-CTERM sorting domain-containing protein [Rhodospirillales bacterium]
MTMRSIGYAAIGCCLGLLAAEPARATPQTLYVANSGNDTIMAFSPAGVGSVFATTTVNPYALAFDSAGNLYASLPDASSPSTSQIEKIDNFGTSSVFATVPLAKSLAFNSAGTLFVSGVFGSAGIVDKITALGVVSAAVTANVAGTAPLGLAFSSAGALFIADSAAGRIWKCTNPNACLPSTFVTSLSGLDDGMAFDSAGNLYVSNFTNNSISKITSGGVVSTFASGLSGPQGLAFDSAGNLFVANKNNNTIDEITPGGVVSVFASTGLSSPIGIAFGAAPSVASGSVPEPTSLAVFSIALLGLGVQHRRRGAAKRAVASPV